MRLRSEIHGSGFRPGNRDMQTAGCLDGDAVTVILENAFHARIWGSEAILRYPRPGVKRIGVTPSATPTEPRHITTSSR